MRVDMGKDYQSKALGGDTDANVGFRGVASATSATSLTDAGESWTVDQWKGKIIAAGDAFGVIRSNTATVATIDQWYNAASATGAAGTTPAGTTPYCIINAAYPARWMGLTEDATAPVAGDTSLSSELTGNGWDRRLCTWAHTAGASTYTLTTTFTSADGTTRTIAQMGLFSSKVVDAGNSIMFFETLVTPTATLISGDQITLTETVTI
jgi:hypothetical protein